MTFVPDGSYLLSGGSDGKITFTKTSNWKVDKVFERAHKGSSVNAISVHPSGKLALSIGSDLTLRTWNLINGRQAFATSLKNKSLGNMIDIVMWSTTGDYFAITGKDTVEVWNTNQASVVATKKCEARPTAICWISDSDLLVGLDNGKMMVFNWEDESEESTLCEIYETRIKAMKFINGFLATASSSGELNLWKVSSEDKVEIEMIAGIEVGCRLICLDVVELSQESMDQEIKDEDEQEVKKTQVRQLKTSGCVTVEVEDDEEEKKISKKRKSVEKPARAQVSGSAKKKKRQSVGVRLSNGFIEEDC